MKGKEENERSSKISYEVANLQETLISLTQNLNTPSTEELTRDSLKYVFPLDQFDDELVHPLMHQLNVGAPYAPPRQMPTLS